MKTRGKVLLFTLLAAAFLMSAQFVHAYSGAWLPNSNDVFSIKMDLQGTDSFSVYDWNDTTKSIMLFDGSAPLQNATFYITLNSGVYTLTFGLDSIDLGTTAEFGFFFGSTGTTYDLQNIGSDAYQLTYGSNIVVVHDAAPVPIPPSALLLGSGVFGMIGFGFRRKSRKA